MSRREVSGLSANKPISHMRHTAWLQPPGIYLLPPILRCILNINTHIHRYTLPPPKIQPNVIWKSSLLHPECKVGPELQNLRQTLELNSVWAAGVPKMAQGFRPKQIVNILRSEGTTRAQGQTTLSLNWPWVSILQQTAGRIFMRF